MCEGGSEGGREGGREGGSEEGAAITVGHEAHMVIYLSSAP